MGFLLRKSGGLFTFFKKDYELLHNGSLCCVLSFYDWKYVEILIDENRYVIRSVGRAKWVLEQSGTKIAYCKRNSTGSKLGFSIEFDGQVWCLKPIRKKLVLTHDIWEEKLKIGRISPHIKLWWPEVNATFKEAPRLEVVSFAVWLIGIHWVGVAGTLTAGRADIGI